MNESTCKDHTHQKTMKGQAYKSFYFGYWVSSVIYFISNCKPVSEIYGKTITITDNVHNTGL